MRSVGSGTLMNCLWYEDITPEQLAGELQIPTGRLFEKIFGDDDFTMSEINQIVGLLNLTKEEAKMVFSS